MHNTALDILKKINNNGYEAYIVGGYPRDLCLNRKSIDIDICTNATPKDLNKLFPKATIPLKEYGSVEVLFNRVKFEITTYRKEFKYDNNRSPIKVEYINSLLDDLKRRDFTINTLCIDKDGNYIDLLNGKADIDAKVIRVVGSPRIKIKEDVFRILRAIRFATILDFDIDPCLQKYIIKYGFLLKKLSSFRKKEELDKIFSNANALKGINLIKKFKLERYLNLSLNNVVITSSPIGIWAQVITNNEYNFTNNEKDMIKKINELKNKEIDDYVLYKYGLYICFIVGEIRGISKKELTLRYEQLPIKNNTDIMITALEICQVLNKKPGVFIKEIFDDLEKKILNGELTNEKDYLLKYVKTYE